MKVRCYNIKWETDGKRVKLPKSITFEIEPKDLDGIEEALNDLLSDTTGWLHNGYDYEILPVTQRQYVKKEDNICPFCGSDNLDGESVDIDANGASQEVSCFDCGGVWQDNYRLTSFTVIQAPKGN